MPSRDGDWTVSSPLVFRVVERTFSRTGATASALPGPPLPFSILSGESSHPVQSHPSHASLQGSPPPGAPLLPSPLQTPPQRRFLSRESARRETWTPLWCPSQKTDLEEGDWSARSPPNVSLRDIREILRQKGRMVSPTPVLRNLCSRRNLGWAHLILGCPFLQTNWWILSPAGLGRNQTLWNQCLSRPTSSLTPPPPVDLPFWNKGVPVDAIVVAAATKKELVEQSSRVHP